MADALQSAPSANDRLHEQLDLLNEELQAIGDLLEQLRTDLQWGLQNGRVSLLLAKPEPLDEDQEATSGADAVTLAIRLNVALSDLRHQVVSTIVNPPEDPNGPETSVEGESEHPDNTTTPEHSPIDLFEEGDAVEIKLDGETWFGEITGLDDAENSAIVQLIPSFEEVEVPQDLLIRIEPDELSRREEVWQQIMDADHETPSISEQPSVGDRVCLNLHGHELSGDILTVNRYSQTVDVVLTPSMETVTVDWSELAPESLSQETMDSFDDRMAEHERWCHEVRDPAQQNSEGSRIVMPANGKALVEYEVAPLPNGEWAVRWAHRFLCGDVCGAGHPWTVHPTRDDCIELVLQTSRKMFSANGLDKVQIPIAREMLHLLGDGLFGFNEPEPQTPNLLDPSGLAAAAEAAAQQLAETTD
ncbi:MAG: hypothetical protein KDA93_01700 [Planctomycetaceae bacterium]|nr:hypothetical protein [Planctomycetaceae bacterium]